MASLSDVGDEVAKAHAMSDMLNDVIDAVARLEGSGSVASSLRLSRAAMNVLGESDYVKALQKCLDLSPRAFRKAWKSIDAVSEEDRVVSRELHERARGAGIPEFVRLSEPFVSRASPLPPWYVLPETHRYNNLMLRPLQRAFSNAVPLPNAIDAIVSLRMGICELGCGSGLWARLLRDRGVDVVAFDIHPPDGDIDDDECIFDQAHIPDIRNGGPAQMVEIVSDLSQRALLLCWPFDEEDEERGWDFDALSKFSGDVLIYVGDWKGRTRSVREFGITSSADFQRKVESEWICETCIPIGILPMVSDELTVWRRRSSIRSSFSTISLPPVKPFCPRCNLDNPPAECCRTTCARIDMAKSAWSEKHCASNASSTFSFNFDLSSEL